MYRYQLLLFGENIGRIQKDLWLSSRIIVIQVTIFKFIRIRSMNYQKISVLCSVFGRNFHILISIWIEYRNNIPLHRSISFSIGKKKFEFFKRIFWSLSELSIEIIFLYTVQSLSLSEKKSSNFSKELSEVSLSSFSRLSWYSDHLFCKMYNCHADSSNCCNRIILHEIWR